MFEKFMHLFKNKSKDNTDKGGNVMPAVAPARGYQLFSEPQNTAKDLLIRRVGKDIVLYDEKRTQVLSGDKIKPIMKAAVEGKSTAKIRTSGLSKAQVEKIAGSFVEDKTIVVEVRHVSMNKKSPSQLQRFEIVIKGGNDDG